MVPDLPRAVEQALYLAGDAPKLRYLLAIMFYEGVWKPDLAPKECPPRFAVFYRWPLVMWMVHMFLDALGLRVATIESHHKAEERDAAKAYFTNPESDCQVLLTSYTCGALGLNLELYDPVCGPRRSGRRTRPTPIC